MTATDRHFLDLDTINANELRSIIDHAKELKNGKIVPGPAPCRQSLSNDI
jgi:ornithine carbamoyltransferase